MTLKQPVAIRRYKKDGKHGKQLVSTDFYVCHGPGRNGFQPSDSIRWLAGAYRIALWDLEKEGGRSHWAGDSGADDTGNDPIYSNRCNQLATSFQLAV